MGRFFGDESPDFAMCGRGDVRGMIHFLLDDCIKLKHKSIDKTCEIHKVPDEICQSTKDIEEPWQRVMDISDACARGGHSVCLNANTVHKEFYWKVYPILFEMVCLELCAGLNPTPFEDGNLYDADIWDDENELTVPVDFKCKHRNAKPRKKYDVTIPINNLNGGQNAVFCFGQMMQSYGADPDASSLNEGYVLGVCSKEVFVNPCTGGQGIDCNEVGTNGASFPYSTVLYQVGKLWKWSSLEEARQFFPMGYHAWRFGEKMRQ